MPPHAKPLALDNHFHRGAFGAVRPRSRLAQHTPKQLDGKPPDARIPIPVGERRLHRRDGVSPRGPACPLPVLVVFFGSVSDWQPNPFTAELCTRGPETGLAVVNFYVYFWGDTGGDRHGCPYGRWAANLADVCTYVAAQ